ncbi:MAG: methyltransferase domain-containing protein [Planctomycetales bacterium]|nr:methyltransferase domain-containing protein [Planctomycetales bacterium]
MNEKKPEKDNRDFYDRISQAYDLLADASEQEARRVCEGLLDAKPGESILEIGFGTGHSLLALAKAVTSTGTVHGIDVSSGMRDVAQARIEEAGVADHVILRIGDARHLPYANQSMDGVFMSFTLELFPLEEIPSVLSEIKRVLRPTGRFANVSMAAVKPGESPSLLERSYVWMHQHFPHIVDCQPIDVEQLLTTAKLRVVETKQLDIWTMPCLAVKAFVH